MRLVEGLSSATSIGVFSCVKEVAIEHVSDGWLAGWLVLVVFLGHQKNGAQYTCIFPLLRIQIQTETDFKTLASLVQAGDDIVNLNKHISIIKLTPHP